MHGEVLACSARGGGEPCIDFMLTCDEDLTSHTESVGVLKSCKNSNIVVHGSAQ